MKKKKKIVIIVAVFCVLFMAYLLIEKLSENKPVTDKGIMLSQISAADMTGFSYQHYNNEEYGDEVYSFIKEDGTWFYEADRDFPVNQKFINAKVQSVAAIYADRVVDEHPADLSVYGLDIPYLTVSATDSENSYIYHVGDYNASTTTYYVLEESTGIVYLADADLFMAFDVQIWDMLDALEKDKLKSLDKNTFTRIKLEYPTETIELLNTMTDKDYVKKQWYLLDENSNILENTDTVSTGQFPALIADISYLREVDYKYEESESEYYGFTEPFLIITVDYMEGDQEKQFVLTIGSQTVENYIYEDYYALTNQSDAVFTIEYSVLESIIAIEKESLTIN